MHKSPYRSLPISGCFIAAAFLTLGILSGCASKAYDHGEPAPAPAPADPNAGYGIDSGSVSSSEQQANYAVVRTYFATDRKMTQSIDLSELFSSERSHVTYGSCNVSIPRDHRPGKLESPSILRLELREKPDEHVVFLSATVKDRYTFLRELSRDIESSDGGSAMVFIHGFNVSFEDAARRTAQMAYDLSFKGVPIFYSWPSKAKLLAYSQDRQMIERSWVDIKQFLKDVLANTTSDNIFLIAHSMGNQGLGRALRELLNEDPSVRQRLKEIILAAPDIDSVVFKEQVVPAVKSADKPVTLYASTRDKALVMSKLINGGIRTGGGSNSLVGVEIIDASLVDSSFIGHSYYGDNRSVMTDIDCLINHGLRAGQRPGLRASKQSGYWEFEPEGGLSACAP